MCSVPLLQLCFGYRDNACRKFLFYLLVLLTFGLILLVMRWKPEWEVKLTKSQCHLSQADTVLLKVRKHLKGLMSVMFYYYLIMLFFNTAHVCVKILVFAPPLQPPDGVLM